MHRDVRILCLMIFWCRYPCHTNLFFFKKLVKYGVLHGISTPALYGLFLHACRAAGGMLSLGLISGLYEFVE